MDIDEAIYRLRLYNEKVEKLQRLNFVKHLLTGGKISASTSVGMDKPLSITVEGPDENDIDAFINTYRFFIQPRDKIDRPHMKEVYEALRDEYGYPSDSIASAIKAIDSADRYFAGYIDFEFNGEKITRRQLHDVMIYGGFAHANRDKKEIYDEWSKSPVSGYFTFIFLSIMADVLRSILSYKIPNERAITFLEEARVTIQDVKQGSIG